MKTKDKQKKTHAVTNMRDSTTIQTTSGYVPIVGTPGDPNFPAPGDDNSTTEYTFSAIENTSSSAATGKKEKTKGYTVTVDAVTQQYLDATNGWTDISGSGGLPFALNVTVGGTSGSVSKDEQFVVEVTNQPNYTTSDTRVIVEYTLTVGGTQKNVSVTVTRPKF